MQYHSMNTDGDAIAACVMETNTATNYDFVKLKIFVRVALMKQLCSERAISTSLVLRYGMDWYARISNIYC